ncbi:Tox-REase-5 domain-containing protein [Mycolicibacterium stellerae]|uniref:Tox-REase-5 domain-containing protein n=1 Tax=Mycolicibacterium stellerae TaxID=2358193 RepID=UPI000F0B3D12|nr:Tox-REase-5 domain-containing protein [Mycolicibacterium stellerae]
MTVSVADIERWDPGDVREVFHATRNRAEAAFEAADGIATLPAFGTWGGEAAVAAREANEKLRKDLDAQGNEALAVAKAARKAADDMEQVKSDLARLEADAIAAGYQINTVMSQVIPGPNFKTPMIIAIAEMAELQGRLDKILADAVRVDEELATAINMATGATPIPGAPQAPIDKTGLDEDAPAESTGPSVLAGINRANDQAVLDAMEKVRNAQAAIDKAAAEAYTHGAGSPEALTAMAELPQLKKNLADALDELGKVPDFSKIDPNSVTLTPDGNVTFGPMTANQAAQVIGTLKNGTGEIYDAKAMAYYTYKDGKLVGTRFLDDGRAIATAEPLLTAVTTAVGVGPLVKGGEGAYLGLRALFGREGADALATVTGENVLLHAVDIAAARSASALDDLAVHGPGAFGPSHEGFAGLSKAYQEFITGRSISEAYIVEGPARAVKFDDFANGMLIDAKADYQQFVDKGVWDTWFQGDSKFLKAAVDQSTAAGDTPIQWVFMQREMADRISTLLTENGFTNIDVVWKPMS